MPHDSRFGTAMSHLVEARQESIWMGRRREEGRKPVLFGNRERNKEALINRKRDRENRGKLMERHWYMYIYWWISTSK